MITLTTPRLLIRNFTSDDAPALREVVLSKESGEYAVYDYQWPTSEEGIASLLDRFSGYDGFLALCVRETGALAGFLSFDREGDDQPPRFGLGYCLHPHYQHLGYVTEACIALLDYAFDVLGAGCVTAGTAAINAPSVAVLRRLGMRKVGEETVAFRKRPDGTPLAFTGWMFEVTREEWAARHERTASQRSDGKNR